MEFDVYDLDDFYRFAASQPEVWTHGCPGYALPADPDDCGSLIYCDEQGWLQIIKRYNDDKRSEGWVERVGIFYPVDVANS